MIFNFVPLNEEYAREMINNWKYEGEFSIYDYINEEEGLLDTEAWGVNRFVVLDENSELVGELTTEFYKEVSITEEDDGYVDIKTVRNNPEIVFQMWIGFGLRPDLTNKGIGSKFVSACVEYAVKFHNYRGEFLRLGVAEFNERARKTYARVGFEVFDTCMGEIGGEKFKILWMRKSLLNSI